MCVIRRFPRLLLLSALLMVISLPGISHAATVTYDLTADATTLSMPDGAMVPAWGFGITGQTVGVPGPILEAAAGDDLIINLTNNLSEPVTIVIHGQRIDAPMPVMLGGRVLSFVPENGTFTFSNLKAGTYLYESGTHPAKQVAMGLYGILVVRPATAGQAYDDPVSAYDDEGTVVLSDIDPSLNAAVQSGSYGTPAYPSTVDYDAKYFLINGKAYPNADPIKAYNDATLLVRFVNAGTATYAPTFNGMYMTAIAEDGNLLPFPAPALSLKLPAGKTVDVLLTPPADSDIAFFDRRLNLSNAGVAGVGGMISLLMTREAYPPVIESFTATPDTILEGESVTLQWTTINTDSVTIEPGVGTYPANGSAVISPAATTTYTLTATGPDGTATADVVVTVKQLVTLTLASIGRDDGTVRESRSNSGVGGGNNATSAVSTALRIGDEYVNFSVGEVGYKTVVSFDTSSVPDTATIQSAVIRLTAGGLGGRNPYASHGVCYVDVTRGSFSGNRVLESADFQATATTARAAAMSVPAAPAYVSTGNLNASGLGAINKVGLTQLRIYFERKVNFDSNSDYVGFYSGDDPTPENRPTLEIVYIP